MDSLFLYGAAGVGLIVIFGLARAFFDRKPDETRRYVGSQLHFDDMTETIERVARRVVAAHPDEDEFQQTRRVRDELVLGKMRNVDMYEGTILNLVKRARSPEEPVVQKWTD